MVSTGRARGSERRVGVRSSWGSNGLGREQVSEIQRARILSGMFDAVCEKGAGNVTVAQVVERSGVSRRTFYELFDDREECFLAAFEQAVAYASERVLAAYSAPDLIFKRGQAGWRERIRAGLLAFLAFLEDEPAIGRLLIVESLAGGTKVLERRGRVLRLIVSAVDAGREEMKNGSPPPPSLTAEGVVGGVLSVLHARLLTQPDPTPGGAQAGEGDRDREPLVGLANQLMGMIVMPYLGSSAARRELERPLQATSAAQPDTVLLSDPFKDAGMRLTYRTVRVLMTIADNSQCSNRQIGQAAGVTDQGQISKLLGRLQRIDLITNTGLGPGQGAPNSWSLTTKGHQVANSIRAHTENPDPTNDSSQISDGLNTEGDALRRELLHEHS
jgi:AcrR family transcriptional regulator